VTTKIERLSQVSHQATDIEQTTPVEAAIRHHYHLLGHKNFGVTELRTFEPRPQVAYSDNENDFVRLVIQKNQTKGIYVGVQPRQLDLFDLAPNCWQPVYAQGRTRCGTNKDVEYITCIYFDIDLISQERKTGHPVSCKQLNFTLQAARWLTRQQGMAIGSVICCSGNGHYLLVPVVPVVIEDNVAMQNKYFCQSLANQVNQKFNQVKADPVFDLARIMRIIGTTNRKGVALPQRPHRRASFVTDPLPLQSMALHYMIINTDVPTKARKTSTLPEAIKCDLTKLQCCEFIQWCRLFPEHVTEPQWFGMMTNLVPLQGGAELIHTISRLDQKRYDYGRTQRLIERILAQNYQPIGCSKLITPKVQSDGFCSNPCAGAIGCPQKPCMFLTACKTIYQH